MAGSRYFTVGEWAGHWWLITPEGKPFFSIGMNHIDSATLRYVESGDVWREKYGNRHQRWLQEAVAPDLRAWGFNTIGWTQEVVIRMPTMHRHSRSFTYKEYQWAGMPYCHLLPFAETHQWEVETRYPDVFSDDFQYFSSPEQVCPDLERWHKLTGKPVLLADASTPGRDPATYGSMIRALRELECCLGWRVCGAYLQNRSRGYGFRDERDEPVEPLVSLVSAANHETLEWVAQVTL